MFGRKKQWKILFFVACVACLFFSYTKTSAFSSSTLGFLEQIDDSNLENFPIKTLLSSYCNWVINSKQFMQNNFLYNAQQSAFVYLLCSNIGIDSPYFKNEEKQYFKRLSFAQLWFQDIIYTDSYQIDLCSPVSFQNDCNIPVVVPKLFNGIINDYINMKQPNLYGMNKNFQTDLDIMSQINQFSSGYFNGIQLCDDARYPKSCSMMKWYIKNVRSVLNDVTIFNASGILEIAATTSEDKTISCSTITLTGDVFYCGLYWDKWWSLPSFVNLVYNELFYYRLFMWYYLSMLQKYPSLLTKNTYMRDYSSILKTFSTQYMWSKDALSLSLRMMRDTYMAFPFHVGFSMYQEDLHDFWKTLARIAPPIYTLDDKLRHVQGE